MCGSQLLLRRAARGGGGQTGSPVPAEGRPGGPGISGGVGTGSPIRCRGVSPGTPMGSFHPRWDPDTQSVEQLGPEPSLASLPAGRDSQYLPVQAGRGWGWGGRWAAMASGRLSARERPCLEAQGPEGTPLRTCPPLGGAGGDADGGRRLHGAYAELLGSEQTSGAAREWPCSLSPPRPLPPAPAQQPNTHNSPGSH